MVRHGGHFLMFCMWLSSSLALLVGVGLYPLFKWCTICPLGENRLALDLQVYFWRSHSTPLLHCVLFFCQYHTVLFIVPLEYVKRGLVRPSVLSICLRSLSLYLGWFGLACELYNFLKYIYEECHWYFDGHWTGSVDYFGQFILPSMLWGEFLPSLSLWFKSSVSAL